jgi:hypothetical protein
MFAQATFARAEQLHHALARTLVVTLEQTLEQTPEFTLEPVLALAVEPALRPEHRLFPVERALEAARFVAVRRAAEGFAIAL